MGIVLSRFRKKNTIEILEDLDVKIKKIEQYGQNTEQIHKKIVGTLVIYSVVFYIIAAVMFYFYFCPPSLYDQIFYITPLLAFPILILFIRKVVSWYFKRKISRNQEKLSIMQREKKKILDEVTETETYKKAKEILLKFAPDQLRMTPPGVKVSATSETPQPVGTPQVPSILSAGDLRKRVLTSVNQSPNLQSDLTPRANTLSGGLGSMQSPQSYITTLANARTNTSLGYRSPLPRPILMNQRTYLDRLVDYLVGDGPSNRYALICRQCGSHNGMALKEEFEYFAFRCCYCNFWNPAKKQKLCAPKLEYDLNVTSNTTLSNKEHTSSEGNIEPIKFNEIDTSSPSDTDSDIEVVERPTELSEIPENTPEQCTNNDESDIQEKEAELQENEQNKTEQASTEPMDIDEDSGKE